MSQNLRPVALIVGCLLVATVAAADDRPVGATVYLKVSEPEGYQPDAPDARFAAPLLNRELVRQAFLIAARDELGLSTRDVVLREDFPEKPDAASVPFILMCQMLKEEKEIPVEYLLYRGQESKDAVAWRWVFRERNDRPHSLTSLSHESEALSRGELKDVLKRAGWGKTVPVARASSAVSAAARELLWAWNEISVLAGVRLVHGEIRDKGESPELLAALAVGYANLGALTEYQHSAACKAYQARALLYAERLLQKTNESPWALWHRAYARTLVGLHNFAADDIVAARRKQKQSTKPKSAKEAAAAPERPLPAWAGVLEAFSEGQLRHMLGVAKTPTERDLARYLNLEAVKYGRLHDLTVKAGRAFLADQPGCPIVQDLMWGEAWADSEPGLQSFTSARDRKRLLKIPALPEELTKRLRQSEQTEDLDAAVEMRKELIADFKRAGAAELDRGEPSLSAVGHLLEDIDFAQGLRRVETGSGALSTYESLCATHPYGSYIDAYTYRKEQMEPAAAALEKRMELFATTFRDRTLLQWIYGMNSTPRLHGWYQAVTLHADTVFRDEMRKINEGFAGAPDVPGFSRDYMGFCWETSNKLPIAVALRISRDWHHARTKATVYHSEYADDPLVMDALADRYFRLKRYDEAEHCAKRLVELAPGFAEYRFLAGVYKAKKDRARWKETLDKALTLPGEGLEHAEIQNEIAQELLEHLEFQEAVPYADASAETGAVWALLTAARCHEMVGNWKRSEEFVRLASERYENAMFSWMFWCHRTGRGDVHAADELAHKRLEVWGNTIFAAQQRQIGVYYLVAGEPENALLLFQEAYKNKHEYFCGLQAALTADALGKTAERDALLKEIISTNLPHNFLEAHGRVYYQQIAGHFQFALAAKNGKLDLAAIEKLIEAAKDTFKPSSAPYFVGVFLKNRGDLENAKKYLQRAAQASDWDSTNHVLACQLLRQLKADAGPDKTANKK